MSRKFGIFMDGCEEQFEAYVRQSYRECNRETWMNHGFVYVELGIGYAETLLAVTQIVREIAEPRTPWAVIGVDVPAEHITEESIRPRFGHIPVRFPKDATGEITLSNYQVMFGVTSISTEGSPDWFLRRPLIEIDFLFLDGCHGEPCVIRDFITIEKCMTKGSFLIFHDAGDSMQGHHQQPHCAPRGIEVQSALRKLGMWESNEKWERVPNILGISECAVYRRK